MSVHGLASQKDGVKELNYVGSQLKFGKCEGEVMSLDMIAIQVMVEFLPVNKLFLKWLKVVALHPEM